MTDLTETETLDRLYLEWSQFTHVRTTRELKLTTALQTLEKRINVPTLGARMKLRVLRIIRETLDNTK